MQVYGEIAGQIKIKRADKEGTDLIAFSQLTRRIFLFL
jgi:hypothetical protein